MTYANYNINVYTSTPQRYIQELATYQGIAQANGFEDVTLGAFQQTLAITQANLWWLFKHLLQLD